MRRIYIAAALLIVLMGGSFVRTSSDGADAGPPIGLIVVLASAVMMFIGAFWIDRIFSAGVEPDISEESWWSRANLRLSTTAPARKRSSTPGPQRQAWKIRALRRLANIATAATLLYLPVTSAIAPTYNGGFGYREPVSIAGIPTGVLMTLLACAMAIGGRIWLERIVRSMWLPESNDRFWRSRA